MKIFLCATLLGSGALAYVLHERRQEPAPVETATPTPEPALAATPAPAIPPAPVAMSTPTAALVPTVTPIPTPELIVAAARATVAPTPAPTPAPARAAAPAVKPDDGQRADHTVVFDTTAAGIEKSIKTWGMGTVGGPGVMQSGLDNMGADQIKVVIMPFPVHEPLTEKGELSANTKRLLDGDLATAKMAGDRAVLAISPGVGGPDPIHPYYLRGRNQIDAKRWADCMAATVRYIKRPVAWAQVFNEPDYGPWNEGSQKDLIDILGRLRGDMAFRSIKLAGPAPLNVDFALDWYHPIKSLIAMGTTHAINGSFDSYARFLQTVKRNGQTTFCPELHNVAEGIIGAEYGLDGAIWWLGCGIERGAFVKACQGKRLGYAEDRPKWTAAAVYRAPGGAVQAFVGSGERNSQPTTYRFECRDRAVYFNGDGPRKAYTLTIERGAEKLVNITW